MTSTIFPGTSGEHPSTLDNFLPGSSLDHVLNHEVKELGTHILVCEVTYSPPINPNPGATTKQLNFRKFFKFQVMKPLDVKTKFYNAEVRKDTKVSMPVCLSCFIEWHYAQNFI